MNHTDILIIAEHADGKLKPVTLELISLSGKIADGRSLSRSLVILGNDLDGLCVDAAIKTGLDIHYLAMPALEHYNGEIYKNLLQSLAVAMTPSYILSAHSSQGMDFAPALATRLSATCITAVNGMDHDELGGILFSRSICNGKFNTFIRSLSNQTVVTVQPGYFTAEPYTGDAGSVSRETWDMTPRKILVSGMEKSRETSSELGNARIIVAAGRGIGDADNLGVIRRFADLFPGAAVAGSRPLIDMGWLEYKHQVGITGTVVSPAVYIACGISGSSQHIAGMNTSGYVVAINTDPHAAIFNVSDLCIVDDLIGFIEAFESIVTDDQ